MRTTIWPWIGAILLALVAALLWIVTPIARHHVGEAGAGEKLLAVDSNHIAIKGYDTVAYFTDGKAVKGSSQFEYVYDDARWLSRTQLIGKCLWRIPTATCRVTAATAQPALR